MANSLVDALINTQNLLAPAIPKRVTAPRIALYDGDISDHFRRKIRNDPPNVLITNPDMLHMGILPYHEKWTTFLAALQYVVVDEAHSYRGVFGSHVANVLRRLERICLRYNSRPTRILCTATVGNAKELGQSLLSLDNIEVVAQSGAPQGKRHMIFIDPEESPSTVAIQLLHSALAHNLRTIVYCRSRRMTELISIWATDKAGKYSSHISSYRAGFLPEERREIEQRMNDGDLLAVISTSALELGIDIGLLDVCILVGYPGSIMSTLQRGGRVGRKGQESAVILLAGEDALDQYFIHNPEQFFERSPEKAVLNPDNDVILARHLECAAAEMSLHKSEAWLQKPCIQKTLAMLERKGLLLQTAAGFNWLAARKRPQRDVDLRGSGASFQIEDEAGNIIGSVDAHQAFRETHPGAVYLHRGRSYTIRELDFGAHRAKAVAETVKWHTRIRSSKDTEILEVYLQGQAFGAPTAFGRLRVTEQITGYERRLNGSQRLLDIQPLDLPPQLFETEGFWLIIQDQYRLTLENKLLHFMGSIHALEHVIIGLMPLMVMADRNDLGGISNPMHPQLSESAVFVYDGLPDGAGLTRAAFPVLPDLLRAVASTLAVCPCETGCPSCTHSPKCGSGNRPIDKAGALSLVNSLLGEDLPQKSVGATMPKNELYEFHAPKPASHPIREEIFQTGLNKNVNLPIIGPIMIFDVETRRSATEVGGWHLADKMGVSLAIVWDGTKYHTFYQDDLVNMFNLLKKASLVVGFNSLRFDYKVLQPFAMYDLHSLPSLDLLVEIKKRLNYRISLDNLANATLNAPKTANGLQALAWWKEGQLTKIESYCQSDVNLTRQLYEFGKKFGYVLFTNKASQKVRCPVDW